MLRERRRHANFKPNRKLDRKSSRGMIYENEELRLRTININAEVERGQSDIKKLRRENYQLRREIWTLRDEYDRLGKLLKNTKCDPYENANSACSYDCGGSTSDCKRGSNDDCRCYSCYLDDDSVSCDMCNENEKCNSKNADDTVTKSSIGGDKASGYGTINASKSNPMVSSPKAQRSEKIDMNFDHLSVVSEECLSNSEDQSNKNTISSSSNSNTINSKSDMNKMDTLKGIDESIYKNFQTTIPPLKHFENLSYKDIGPNIESLSDIQFNGEMYQASEPTPPPPTPPPLPAAVNRKSGSLPLPPPPTIADDGTVVDQQDNSNETESVERPKYFFAPLKGKRKMSVSASSSSTPAAAAATAVVVAAVDAKSELRPDVLLVNNVVPSDGNRLATIRKPHNPLKYPSNTNAASIDPEESGELDSILQDIQGLSKGIETMQMQQKNANTYENVKHAKSTTSSDSSDHSHPYRTEMSLILSYNGNKSKYSTNKPTDKNQESETETPPPNLPQAMKLFPNKLMYTPNNNNNSNHELLKPTQNIVQQSELANENIDNSANEKMLTKSQRNLTHENANKRKSEKKSSSDRNDIGNSELKPISSSSIRDNNESTSILKTTESNGVASEVKNTDDCHSKKSSPSESVKDGKSRRVSIHFNGIPMSDEPDDDPHSNNDSDDLMTSAAEKVAEELVSAAISCRRASRRFSCSRKLSEDSIGSFLYPPNPFGFVGGGVGGGSSYKRDGRKMSFLSRRHSDTLIPSRHNQYFTDYETPKKTTSRYHCHRNHLHQNHHLNPDHLCNLGESTGTSICNSIASSRESLGSDSQQSSRRKMSITSHSKGGGKIPWCACWGNGCL